MEPQCFDEYYVRVISMGMLFRNILLAEHMVHRSRITLVKYYVKRRENEEFAILETTQLDIFSLHSSHQQLEDDQ